MNYLAFDIEAANGYMPSSVCSVGIVIADEKFNIVHRENIWINPKTKYNLNGTRENVGIDLHLDKQLLDSSPDFAGVYDKIRSLLTNPSNVVLGHAVDADVRMLNAACARYHLPSIDFKFICSQLLYRLYKGEKEVKGLNKIAAEIGVEFCQHNSEDDAYVSMLTLKYLVNHSGLTTEQLLQKYHVRIGSNHNFEMIRPVSEDGQLSKRHVTRVAVNKIKKYLADIKPTSNEWSDKVFAVARSLELSQGDELQAVLFAIASKGGRYTSKLAKCNVYICADEPSPQDVLRERRVDELCEQGLAKRVNWREIAL